MPGNDDIVLKLIIRGQDPAEIQRLAAETSGRLANESKQHIDRLTQLHKAASEEQSNAMKKAIDVEIKESQKLLQAIQQIERQREIAHNKTMGNFDRMMERLENITVVATGAWNIIIGGAGRLKALGDDIDRITNVYGSLTGSIEQMREASRGEISDFDLITTKNRALEKDLKLTDQQFGMVAAAADKFADAIGVNTKEALDQLVDGLATGRLKTLEHAGVVVDAEAAYERYARSIGTTTDRLSDQGKRIAIIQDALRAMDKKVKESGEGQDDFSHKWEKTTAQLQNVADAIKLDIGGAVVWLVGQLNDLSETFDVAAANWADAFAIGGKTNRRGQMADDKANRGSRAALMNNIANQKFHRGDMVPEDFLQSDKYRYGGDATGSIKPRTPGEISAAAARAKSAADAQEKFNRQFQQMLLGGKSAGAAYGLGPDNSTSMEQATGFEGGVTGGADEYVRDNDAKAKSYEELQKKIRGEAQTTADKMAATMEQVAKRKDELLATNEMAGGGLVAMLFFGTDGPDKIYSEMDDLEKATVHMSSMISEAAGQMAQAVGVSLADWVSNSQGAKKSFQDVTNELLKNLAAQAYTQGLMELAHAAAAAATYNFDAAARHVVAAVAYGAVGTGAALAAGAVGHSVATSRPTKTTSSGAGSGGGSRSSSASGSSSPFTINLTVLPGGEAEAGRAINKALDAYYSQTGRGRPAAA